MAWISSTLSGSSQVRPSRSGYGLIEYFKAKAGERGYQTLINDTLRQARERENLEETLRRVIREELHRDSRAGSP